MPYAVSFDNRLTKLVENAWHAARLEWKTSDEGCKHTSGVSFLFPSVPTRMRAVAVAQSATRRDDIRFYALGNLRDENDPIVLSATFPKRQSKNKPPKATALERLSRQRAAEPRGSEIPAPDEKD